MPPFRRALALSLLLVACTSAETPAPGADGEASTGSTASPSFDPRLAVADSARILGPADAAVWVVEVSDYQCPFCRNWHEQVYPALMREFVEPGTVRFAYVHFPLPSHRHAQLAAEAAMCAGAQRRFWEYHDRLFATQQQWAALDDARPVFDSLVVATGLDAAAHRSCVAEGVMRDLVRADAERMERASVNSTPTFFVGDQVIVGLQPIEVFREAIARALAATGRDTAGADSAGGR
jgi:protein-disulfide isomerase